MVLGGGAQDPHLPGPRRSIEDRRTAVAQQRPGKCIPDGCDLPTLPPQVKPGSR